MDSSATASVRVRSGMSSVGLPTICFGDNPCFLRTTVNLVILERRNWLKDMFLMVVCVITVICKYNIHCPKLFLVSVKRILLESFITSDSCDAVI